MIAGQDCVLGWFDFSQHDVQIGICNIHLVDKSAVSSQYNKMFSAWCFLFHLMKLQRWD